MEDREAQDLESALAHWGLEGAKAELLGGGTANANFKISHLSGTFVLRRRSPRYSSPERLEYYHALMRHLADNGVRTPFPLPTCDGQSTVKIGENAYELQPWLPGDAIIEPDEQTLELAGRELALFHKITATFKPPKPPERARIDPLEELPAGFAETTQLTTNAAELETLRKLQSWAEKLFKHLPDEVYWNCPALAIHGDFHPANVNINSGRLTIFDLDNSSFQPRLRDLADALLFFCATREGPFDASNIWRLTRECWLQPKRNKIFLEAYGELSHLESQCLLWVVVNRWLKCRTDGRRKVPREQWPAFVCTGVLTPLDQLEKHGLV